ncbi:hypothetical protein ACWGM0_08690 [Sphingomonas bisphenolicum]
MRHSLFPSASSAATVVYPWEYVAMRRRAAALSQEALAKAMSLYNEPHTYLTHIRCLETVGLRFRDVVNLSRAMPFSIDVYRQLADLPPHQHPRLCATCGWDERTDQPDHNGDLTTWSRALPAICTRCEQAALAPAARI